MKVKEIKLDYVRWVIQYLNVEFGLSARALAGVTGEYATTHRSLGITPWHRDSASEWVILFYLLGYDQQIMYVNVFKQRYLLGECI